MKSFYILICLFPFLCFSTKIAAQAPANYNPTKYVEIDAPKLEINLPENLSEEQECQALWDKYRQINKD